jgi:hypothetical protein
MLELVSFLLSTLAGFFRRRNDILVKNLLLRHQLRSLSVPILALTSRPKTGSSGCWSGASTRLEAASDPGPSRHPGADRHHGQREPALGHRAYPRRAPQARHRVSSRSIRHHRRRRQTRPPSQSWRTFLVNHAEAVWTADLFVVQTLTSQTLCHLLHQSWESPACPLRSDRPSDRRLGLAAADRSHTLGPQAAISGS